MPVLIQAKVSGHPRTKGSLNGVCTRNKSHTIHYTEQVEQSSAWRKRVARVLREAQLAEYGRFLQHAGPVEVRLVFHYPRTAASAGGIAPSHETTWPTVITLGDIDKLARNVLDALSAPTKRDGMEGCSALIKDDSQVVLLSVGKFWAHDLAEPGVDILVMGMESGEPERIVDEEFDFWDTLKEGLR
jgi:Holliday junction resolvase RusA-like endonuclease